MAAKKKPATAPVEDDRQMDLPPGVRDAEADPAKPKRTRKPKAAAKTEPEIVPCEPKKPKPAASKPDPKPEPEKEPTKPTKPVGVSLKETAKFQAGGLLARHGLANGVPAELVAELAAMQGKELKPQHGFDLRDAFQAIRGYLTELGQLPDELK